MPGTRIECGGLIHDKTGLRKVALCIYNRGRSRLLFFISPQDYLEVLALMPEYG
ncbi:MAG: hypothetical protein IPJ90_22115 [Anaerolineaceae bacterium]|nr:hypothetical protein [Anaerolineaceae bacterium]